jgi:ABC-type methionine transport system ATPase subunit
VLGLMRELAEEGRTMMVVTHEMSFARDVSNKVMFLHQGRVEEEGNPKEIFAHPKSERSGNSSRPSIDGRDSLQPSVLSTIDVFIKERYMNKLMLATADDGPVFR